MSEWVSSGTLGCGEVACRVHRDATISTPNFPDAKRTLSYILFSYLYPPCRIEKTEKRERRDIHTHAHYNILKLPLFFLEIFGSSCLVRSQLDLSYAPIVAIDREGGKVAGRGKMTVSEWSKSSKLRASKRAKGGKGMSSKRRIHRVESRSETPRRCPGQLLIDLLHSIPNLSTTSLIRRYRDRFIISVLWKRERTVF